MISGFILAVHVAGAVYAFFRLRRESLGEGFLAVAFFIVLFSVAWTITTMAISPLMNAEFVAKWYNEPAKSEFSRLAKRELNRDTIVLLLVSLCEIVFYYFYLKPGKKSGAGGPTAA